MLNGMSKHMKNLARKYRAKGNSNYAISRHLRVEESAIVRYFNYIDGPVAEAPRAKQKEFKPEPLPDPEVELTKLLAEEEAMEAGAPIDDWATEAPVELEADKHGPLPHTKEWSNMKPTDRAKITRKRNTEAQAA